MVSSLQAVGAFTATREFFSSGPKSNNKRFGRNDSAVWLDPTGSNRSFALAYARGEWIPTAKDRARVVRRDEGAERSALDNAGIDLGNRTPLQFGQSRYAAGQKSGNCGIMACVAIWLAHDWCSVPANEMWLVTIKNTKIDGPEGKKMSFGHSYALLGAPGSGAEFIVDPWANVCCRKADYAGELEAQLKSWHQIGKRINIDYGAGQPGAYGYWTNANDKAVLSLVGPGQEKTQFQRADQ